MNHTAEFWLGMTDETPLGRVWVAQSPAGLAAVAITADEAEFRRQVQRLTGHEGLWDNDRTASALAQINDYLHGRRQQFDLPLDWSGMSPFQQLVLRAVCQVPYGATASYGEIARRIGRDRQSARAVGQANGSNSLPLIIPCHRIVGEQGQLQGYGGGGGLATKAWLLRLEGSRLL
jgi:methylated-DNA-[protein]-cysteine S-methyltransferase